MKKIFYLIMIICFFGLESYSQIISRLTVGESVSKGIITTKNGQSESFKKLTFNDGVFTYTDLHGNTVKKQKIDVIKVIKKGNYLGLGAASGGLVAALISLQAENQIQKDISNGYGASSGRFPLYLGMAVGFTGVGALVGYFIKKDKTLYVNMGNVSLAPSYLQTPDNNFTPMVSLKINLSSPR